ncbi:MAG TPA: TonB-dependent receptor, partial [Sphingomonas sp.]|nr:TonB-dependent receptor [Sphingomonas sp.]
GYPLQNAPKWGVSAGFNYDLPLGPADLSFGMSYHYTSKKYLNAINDTPRALVQPTNYIDANIDFTPTNSWWSIGLWGKNLLNHHYIASVYDAPGTIGLVNYTPPREYGVTVKAHF